MMKKIVILLFVLLIVGIGSVKAQGDPDPGPVPPYAPDDPLWDPGQPVPYSWNNITIYLWWPWSYTPRAYDWKCYAKARNLEDFKSYTLEFQDSSIPTSIEHRFMITVFNFTYLNQPTSRWSLYDGSCVIINRNGTIMYSVPIGLLPWTVEIDKGHQVFVPTLKAPHRFIIAGEE